MSQTTAFDQTEFDLAYPDGVENNYWTIARNRLLLSTIRRNGLAGENWIEVGCGRGVVVRHLRENGVACRGVELADVKPLADVATAVAVNQDARALPPSERAAYTGLLLLDVIEHLEVPEQFLSDLLEHLPNVQHVLVTVPARAEIWSNYDEFYGHFRRYDPALLKETLRAVGLTPRKTRYFFHALYPAARALLSLQKERAVKIAAPTGWQKPLHRLIAAGFMVESALLPGFVRGTSLLCLTGRAVDTPHRQR
jgi:2-polyprenyl-3-methyl-5-hydroxy-6-metoxy-1,4-benzoquinol methylase